MFRRLDSYLFRQLLTAWGFIVVAMTLVVLLILSFRVLSLVIENAGSLGIFLQLIALTIPTFLPVVLPVSLAAAVIFMIHKLAMDSELVVMSAAGVSLWRLLLPAVMLGLIVTGIGLLTSTIASPWANRELVRLQYEVRSNVGIFLLRAGTFNDIVTNLTFYARRRDREGGLEGILIHDTRKPATPVTIMAERGMMVMRAKDEPRLIVFNGIRQEYDKRTKKLSELRFDNYTFDLRLLRGSIINRTPDPREIPTAKLFTNDAKFLQDNNYKAERLRAEGHQRLANPFLSLAAAFISVALLLFGEFNRRGLTNRMGAAIVTIIVLLALQLWLTNLSVKAALFIPMLYGMNLAAIMAGIALLLWPSTSSLNSNQAAADET